MFHQQTFDLKQLLTSLHILLIRVDKEQGRNSMATVHTFQNRLQSLLVGNDIGRKQLQGIENNKEYNECDARDFHFSDPVDTSFWDFSDLINTPFQEPDTFSDPIVITSWDPSAFSCPTYTSFLESLANSPSSFLHS